MPWPRGTPACPQELESLRLSWVSAVLCLQAESKTSSSHFFLMRPLAARLEHEGTMTTLCRAELSYWQQHNQLPKALFFISFAQCQESFLGATLPLVYDFFLSPLNFVVSDPLISSCSSLLTFIWGLQGLKCSQVP